MKRKSKFNISEDKLRRSHNEIVFDSKMEKDYYCEVVLPMLESGDLDFCEMQKPYTLQPKFTRCDKSVQPIVYVADFFLRYKDGKEVVVDIKGCPDSVAKLKRKMFWFTYPDIDYQWICKSKIDGGWCSYEYVEQQRRLRRKNKS